MSATATLSASQYRTVSRAATVKPHLYNWTVTVTVSFIPTGKKVKTKKGLDRDESIRVEYRTLWLTLKPGKECIHPAHCKLTCYRRSGETRYTLSGRKDPLRPYFEGGREGRRDTADTYTSIRTMNRDEARVWLAWHLGKDAGVALLTLETQPPEPK